MSMIAFVLAVCACTGQAETTPKLNLESDLFKDKPVSKAENIPIPGTRATLPLPPGFDISQNFTGLSCAAIGASIMVTELPAPMDEVSSAFEGQSLEAQGMTLIESEETIVGERPALLVHARQLTDGDNEPYEKWMLITGTDEIALLVTAAYPESISENVSRALESTIRAVDWDPDAEVDRMAGLPYHIKVEAPFDVANRMAQGVLLTPDGTLSESTTPEPFFAISMAEWDETIDQDTIQRLTRQRLEQSGALGNLEILSVDDIEVGGMPGAMIVASGVDARLEADVIAFLAMVFAEGKYYVLQGATPPASAEENIAKFERMTQSLKVVQ